jgi:hypothetical protein
VARKSELIGARTISDVKYEKAITAPLVIDPYRRFGARSHLCGSETRRKSWHICDVNAMNWHGGPQKYVTAD